MERSVFWSVLWGGFLALVAASALFHGDFGELREPMVAGVLGWIASVFLRPGRNKLSEILVVTLVLIGAATFLEWGGSAWTWTVRSEHTGLRTAIERMVGGSQRIADEGVRSWQAQRAVTSSALIIEGRIVAGESGWQWDRSDADIELKRLDDATGTFTRIRVPEGRDPYLIRSYRAERPLADTRFRVTLEARAMEPIAAEGCRGVWLQVWGPGGDASCLALELGPSWTSFTHEWKTPPRATSKYLRLVLNDFDGQTFDVRRVRLFMLVGEAWTEVRPLLGSAPFVEIAVNDTVVKEVPLPVEKDLSRMSIPLPSTQIGVGDVLTASLVVPQDMAIAVKTSSLSPEDSWDIVPSRERRSLWFGHPNLMGHATTTLGVSLLAIATNPFVLLAGMTSAFGALVGAGSRTAFWVLIAAIVLVAVLRRRQEFSVLLVILLAAGIAGMIAFPSSLARLTQFDAMGSTSRPDIWRAAMHAWLESPWTGNSAGWRQALLEAGASPSAAATITHAHNLWLEFAIRFGAFGLLASVWLGVGLLVAGRRFGGNLGLLTAGLVLAMQVSDFTLLTTWVLVPLVVTLTALESRCVAPRPHSSAKIQD